MKAITVKLKSSDKISFRFSGVASSESRDTYGEIIRQRGIDLSLVKQGKVVVNAEHDGAAIGKVEYADIRNGRLYVEGIVYVRTLNAKRFYDLLKKSDPNRPVTLSIEFVNPEYSKSDKSTLTDVVLTGVALIGLKDEPANTDTYAELLKSVSKNEILNELIRRSNDSPLFKSQLLALLAKHNL